MSASQLFDWPARVCVKRAREEVDTEQKGTRLAPPSRRPSKMEPSYPATALWELPPRQTTATTAVVSAPVPNLPREEPGYYTQPTFFPASNSSDGGTDHSSSSSNNSLPASQKRPQRRQWNRPRIDKWAQEAARYELEFGQQLQTWLGPDYVVQPHANKFQRHDFVVHRRERPDVRVKVELECGIKQAQWQNHLSDNRSRWVQGLNVLSRKVVEGQHFDVFIKHSKTHRSFFAATYEFIKTRARAHQQRRHSLDFVTDDVVWSIPWTYVDAPVEGFCFDDPEQLKGLLNRFL